MAEVSINQTRGADIPEKFNGDPRLLAQSYLELEKKFSELNSNQPTSTSETPGAPETPAPAGEPEVPGTTEEDGGNTDVSTVYGEGITSAVAAAGLDINDIAKQWETTGEVDSDTKSKLGAIFGESVVDSYFAGLQATAAQQTSQVEKAVFDVTGGKEGFDTISRWAATNEPQLTEVFNAALESGNASTLSAATIALKARYESSNGSLTTQSVTAGQQAASGASEGFTSTYEMTQAINSDKYRNDPSFRAEVAKKIAASKGLEVK